MNFVREVSMKKILSLIALFLISCGGGSSPKVSVEKKNAFKEWVP